MKKIFLICVAIVFSFLIYKTVVNKIKANEEQKNLNLKIENSPNIVLDKPSRLEEFKTELNTNQKAVKDFLINDTNVLYVSVIDDGTDRTGLANYFCQLSSDYQVKLFKVKIVKFGSMNSPKRDNSYGILLGESQCN